MNEQLSHNTTSFSKIEFPIILLLDNVTGEANIGSLFRLADAFGVKKLIFCGSKPNLSSNRLKRTARNTHNTVSYEFYESVLEIIPSYKKQNYKVLGIEITSNSELIGEINCEAEDKVVLIAGNERHGISPEVLKECDNTYHIEMYGENSSMNVAQSVGIGLYELTKALKEFHRK
ncbi:TrmH family RNA methyltransferase [Christiangramia salexigens]|uniref:RNA methyltransferase n=1 Tax=Christiangramia salexigens TaxID=1913577 RepID=A0A1L3J322_9FLAO|nr:TrmH family RNA methyltransferase [Christiangramia salexigens]APG59519.1 RNA methyltransferase [Christiangramia salexigens]